MKRIGERIKKQREKLKLPLGELARKVGITSSALSQIENAKSFPSIVTLKSIAEFLHTSVSELIGENESQATSPVVKRNDITPIECSTPGIEIYLLSEHDTNKHMDTYLIRLQPNAELKDIFANQTNQQFCHVIKGNIAFRLNETEYVLQLGDNAYFQSKVEHCFTNLNTDTSELILIISPPND